MDDPAEEGTEQTVLDFLKSVGADFDNVISKSGPDGLEEFGVPGGSIPFYQLFDRKGELRYQFSPFPEGIENTELLEKMDQRLAELLAENKDD